jgi:hypothetical protein
MRIIWATFGAKVFESLLKLAVVSENTMVCNTCWLYSKLYIILYAIDTRGLLMRNGAAKRISIQRYMDGNNMSSCSTCVLPF